MADFLLSVGVDVGLSYTQMQDDISTLVSQLNSNPPRILVSLETDPAAVSQLRSQIDAINQAVNAVGSTATGSGTIPIESIINDLEKNIADDTVRTEKAIKQLKSKIADSKLKKANDIIGNFNNKDFEKKLVSAQTKLENFDKPVEKSTDSGIITQRILKN